MCKKEYRKTSSNEKNRAVVFWEYFYTKGDTSRHLEAKFILKQYLARYPDTTAVIVMGILSVH